MFYFYILWKNFNFPGKWHLNARIMLNAFTPLKCSQNASIMYKSLHLGGPYFCQKNKYCCSFGEWQIGNRIVRYADRFEWNKTFPIILAIPSKRVYSKRIPKFSNTFAGVFTVPFNFGPEISRSEFLVEWKAPDDRP